MERNIRKAAPWDLHPGHSGGAPARPKPAARCIRMRSRTSSNLYDRVHMAHTSCRHFADYEFVTPEEPDLLAKQIKGASTRTARSSILKIYASLCTRMIQLNVIRAPGTIYDDRPNRVLDSTGTCATLP